jgi:hypothetical protein
MIPIISSNIAAAGVQPNGDLHVKFHSGQVYVYEDVPRPVCDELITGTTSAGRYFNRMIKPLYACHKLDQPTNSTEGTTKCL